MPQFKAPAPVSVVSPSDPFTTFGAQGPQPLDPSALLDAQSPLRHGYTPGRKFVPASGPDRKPSDPYAPQSPSGGGTPASAPGRPVAPPAPIPDPKIKAINDREESQHLLEQERARRRRERDSLRSAKAARDTEAAAAGAAFNRKASEARLAEGRTKRPQNFNADGTPKSAADRVKAGTANATDELMALPEGETRDKAFAAERAKSKSLEAQGQARLQSTLSRLAAERRMMNMGLNPRKVEDVAKFNDMLRLVTS